MTLPDTRPTRRSGFTLIELLTVVAIISLLIGILLPSLSKARDQAKRAKTAGLLAAIDKSLEMFNNDFKDYPDSRFRADPIDWSDSTFPAAEKPVNRTDLCGAYWLARALVGHDSQGVDAEGKTMTEWSTTNQPRYGADLLNADRKGNYIDNLNLAKDNDTAKFRSDAQFDPTLRTLVYDDSFGSPVLYYRANTRAREPFCWDGKGTANPGSVGDKLGIYRQEDNALITGSTPVNNGGWDFGSTGLVPVHEIREFGYEHASSSTTPGTLAALPADVKNSFARYLYNPSALTTGGTVRPLNADKFILITAGKDGRFGTADDVTDFKSGL